MITATSSSPGTQVRMVSATQMAGSWIKTAEAIVRQEYTIYTASIPSPAEPEAESSSGKKNARLFPVLCHQMCY